MTRIISEYINLERNSKTNVPINMISEFIFTSFFDSYISSINNNNNNKSYAHA